jgi:hypothetical protein
MQLLLGVFLQFNTIKINSPTVNQIVNNSSFLINYSIERNYNNNKLFVTNTTTELLDVSGMVRLDMITFVQPNTLTNFTFHLVNMIFL